MASVEHMIGYLLACDPDDLTEWEQEFLTGISEMETETKLTASQLSKLREIYDAH